MVAIGMGIIIIAITVFIAGTITIATNGNAPPQRKTQQKKNSKENRFHIHKITPFFRFINFDESQVILFKKIRHFLQLTIIKKFLVAYEIENFSRVES